MAANSGVTAEVKRGSVFRFKIAVKNKGSKTPYDLTGYDAKIDVLSQAGDLVFSISTAASGLTNAAPATGILSGTFSEAQTLLLTAGETYNSDCRIDNGTDVIYTPPIYFRILRTYTSG